MTPAAAPAAAPAVTPKIIGVNADIFYAFLNKHHELDTDYNELQDEYLTTVDERNELADAVLRMHNRPFTTDTAATQAIDNARSNPLIGAWKVVRESSRKNTNQALMLIRS